MRLWTAAHANWPYASFICATKSRTGSGDVIARQLLRSGTSVGAHYREGVRSRSDAELISKFEGALQELDETAYWLEVIVESRMIAREELNGIAGEVNELLAILVTCVRKVKANKRV